MLVTGAAKRIGRGIALRLAREGARVAIHYGSLGSRGARQRPNAAARTVSGEPGERRRNRSACLQEVDSSSAGWTAW